MDRSIVRTFAALRARPKSVSQESMIIEREFALWAGVLVVAFLLCHLISARFNPEVRVERKRRRNYGRVVAKARRPVVMLNVRSR